MDWLVRREVQLESGEEIKDAWRESVLLLIWRLMAPLLLAGLSVALFALTFRLTGVARWLVFGPLLPLSLSILFWIIALIIQWYARIFVLTNRRLIRREGIIWTSRNEVQLPKVQNASYSAITLQKWVGLGTVKVETASAGPPLLLDNVRGALDISRQILKAADEAKRERELMGEEQVRRMLEASLVPPATPRIS